MRALHAALALGVELAALWAFGAAGWALTLFMGGGRVLPWLVAALAGTGRLRRLRVPLAHA